MTHIDSWEVGEQDWTPRMAEEFRRRRGYDLTAWLLALTDGPALESAELTARFRRDFKRTQSELLCENYAGAMRSLANRRGLRLSIEAYGPSGGFLNPLDYGAEADLPMAEFWVKRRDAWHLASPRLLASVAHAAGKTIVGAEGFTASPQNGNWNDHPYTIKALGDWAFCEGITRLVMHRMVLQPWTGRCEPGMTFGPFGTHFDRNQTWWEPGAAFMAYVARCQYLLQQGQFVADVCRLVPDGENFGSRPRMEKLPGRFSGLPEGYNHDYLSDRILTGNVTVRDHRIVLPGGMSYRLLQLPDSDALTPDLLRRIRELVTAGATVVGPRPRRSPGLEDYPRCDGDVQALAAEMWGDCDGKTNTEHALGSGRIVWGKPLDAVLRETAGAPDLGFTVNPPVTEASLSPVPPRGRKAANAEASGAALPRGLNWIHRRSGQSDIYFLANPQHRPVDALCTFRVTDRRPEFWDPETGARVWPAAFVGGRDGTLVPVRFSPAGSVFVVFRQPVDPAAQVVEIKRDGNTLFGAPPGAPVTLPELVNTASGTQLRTAIPGRYELTFADGRTRIVNVSASLPATALRGPWQLRFQSGRGAPDSTEFPTLVDWAAHEHDGIRHFSGTASYSTAFDWHPEAAKPEGRAAQGDDAERSVRHLLDLGRVEVIAEVVLNGKPVGVLWKPPFEIDVTGALQAGRNDLRVRVTNLWANRLIGDERYPDDCTPDGSWKTGALPEWPPWLVRDQPRPESRRVTFTSWKYYNMDSPLLPSGLLGPVTLRAAEQVSVR